MSGELGRMAEAYRAAKQEAQPANAKVDAARKALDAAMQDAHSSMTCDEGGVWLEPVLRDGDSVWAKIEWVERGSESGLVICVPLSILPALGRWAEKQLGTAATQELDDDER